MPLIASTPFPIGPGQGRERPLWQAVSRLWRPAEAPHEADLGYESALPWAVGLDGPAEPLPGPAGLTG